MKVTFYRAIGLVVAMLALLAVISGCSNNSNPTSPTDTTQHSSHFHTIAIAGFAFSPAATTVAAGDTVNWKNNDTASHTVTSDTGSELGSSALSQGQSYQHIFSTAGTFAYHCSIHPAMHGSVTVQ